MAVACGRKGCKAFAVRGARFCYAHRFDGKPERVAVEDRAGRSDRFALLVRSGDGSALVERGVQSVLDAAGGTLSLRDEVGGLRLILQRVVVVDGLEGDIHQAAVTVAQLTSAIVEAVRAERLLTGGAADDLALALDRVLGDMGIGGAGE